MTESARRRLENEPKALRDDIMHRLFNATARLCSVRATQVALLWSMRMERRRHRQREVTHHRSTAHAPL